MRCASCGFENPDGMNFCGKCAASLTPRCSQCGFENPSGFAFCGKCAAPLAGRPPSVQSSPFPVSAPPASYTIAKKQQAKSLELRAVMSLAQLWQQQGKKIEAHQMLAEIYGWFTEGFETKDLQEAKELIESLSN